jgi:butyryl-CoA dehydrogenase
MAYGAQGGEGLDGAGAVAWLVGHENRGLETMFIMMNAARYGVGLQGVALAERAYQQAVQFARDRVQSRPVDGSMRGPAPIIHHPDVRRMLMTMRANTEAARALAYVTAAAYDTTHASKDPVVKRQNQALYEYLVPVVKGWSTELSVEVASLGIQVQGGMGYIEETGAAQYFRDSRILPIYEGTTAIQANDLVGRKTARDRGETARVLVERVRQTAAALAGSKASAQAEDLAAIAKRLEAGAKALEEVVNFIVANAKADVKGVYAGSVPYLKLAGIVLGGWQMARAAGIASAQLDGGSPADAGFARAKLATARFFADHVLTQAPGLRDAIVEGSKGVLALDVEQF